MKIKHGLVQKYNDALSLKKPIIYDYLYQASQKKNQRINQILKKKAQNIFLNFISLKIVFRIQGKERFLV